MSYLIDVVLILMFFSCMALSADGDVLDVPNGMLQVPHLLIRLKKGAKLIIQICLDLPLSVNQMLLNKVGI